jgi:hypothetical protein
MALYAAASRGVEAARGVGVLVPRGPVLDYGATFDPVHERRGHESDSPDPGGPRLRARGSPGGLHGRDLRGNHTRRSREHKKDWSNDIVEFSGMAGRSGRTKRSVSGQFVQAVETLAKGQRPDGNLARICLGTRARRKNAVIRHQGGLPTLPPCTADARLVFFCIRWQILQVHRPFGWGLSPMWFNHLMVPLVTKLRLSY